jgi:3-deoxy-manno-octulosonate cytidylyltransferase (CMP-KDO synthetase)
VAGNLAAHRAASIATACTPISDAADLANPGVVKLVMDKAGYALYFSRAAIPHARDAFATGIPEVLPRGLPVYRHLGLYAYRAGFLKAFKKMRPAALEQFEALEQLRALAYGHRISVAVTRAAPHPGVDTPADLQRVLAHMQPGQPRRR